MFEINCDLPKLKHSNSSYANKHHYFFFIFKYKIWNVSFSSKFICKIFWLLLLNIFLWNSHMNLVWDFLDKLWIMMCFDRNIGSEFIFTASNVYILNTGFHDWHFILKVLAWHILKICISLTHNFVGNFMGKDLSPLLSHKHKIMIFRIS